MFNLFHETESFSINEKPIRIIYEIKLSVENKNKLKEAIERALENNAFFKLFPSLIFRIESKDIGKYGNASVSSEDLKDGIFNTIRINVELLLKLEKKLLEREQGLSSKNVDDIVVTQLKSSIEGHYKSIQGYWDFLPTAIVHELTHLWDELKSRSFTRFHNYSERMDKSLKSLELLFGHVPKQKDYSLLDIRNGFMIFSQTLRSEGLAQFCQSEFDGKLHYIPSFNKYSREETENIAINLGKMWDGYVTYFSDPKNIDSSNDYYNFEAFIEIFKKMAYYLGEYMIYRIVYYEGKDVNASLEKIVAMNHIDFIKYYEKVEIEEGNDPIVSYNSGRGIIDCSDLIKKWFSVIKMYMDKK